MSVQVEIKEAQLKELWQVICLYLTIPNYLSKYNVMVITKAFRMQFLICRGHDHKTFFPLGFLSATLLAFILLGTFYYPLFYLHFLEQTVQYKYKVYVIL